MAAAVGNLALGSPAIARNAIPPNTGDLRWTQGAADLPLQRAFNLRTKVTPQLRALCLTESGVTQALEFARAEGLPFAIQSSGHCFAGLSQSETFVIDLRRLNGLRFDETGQTVTAGPGATVGDLNGNAPGGTAVVPLGFCQTVALGGHVTGGGIGYLNRMLGLACDHLVSARVALADGSVVVADHVQNPDLFWALRGGGGGSFGVVTALTCRLNAVPQAAFVTMAASFSETDLPKPLASILDELTTAPRSVSGKVFLFKPRRATAVLRVSLVAAPADPHTDAIIDRISRALSDAKPIRTQGPFPSLTDTIYPRDHYPTLDGRYGSDFLATVPPAAAWRDVVPWIGEQSTFRTTMIVEALGGAMADVAPDETAFPHRRNTPLLVQYASHALQPDAAPSADAAMAEMILPLKPYTTGGAYVCYPDLQRPEWQQAFWGANYPRLRAVKARVDPENVFRHALSVEP